MKKLEDYLKYEQPTKYIVDSEKYSNEYDIPVLTAGKSFILGYTNEKNNIFPKEELPVIIFDDFTTDCKYVDFPFKVKSSAMKILRPINNANAKFLYYYMKNIRFDSTLHKRYWISEYSQLSIKELNSKMQDEFANKMQKLEKLIELKNKQLQECNNLIKSQFVEMFGDPVINDREWNIDEINNVAPVKNYRGEFDSNKVWLLNLDMVESNSGKVIEYLYEDINNIGNSTCSFSEDNVLYSKLRPYLNKVVIPDKKGFATSEMVPLLPRKEKLNKVFLTYLLRSNSFVDYISVKVSGAKMPRVIMEEFRKFKVILPPIELQNKFAMIVEQIDKQKFVNANLLQLLVKNLKRCYNNIIGFR